jgi:hypothetical protein
MSVEQYVLDEVERRTEAIAEGKQNAHGPLWTGVDGIRQDGAGEGSPFSTNSIRDAADRLVDDGRLFSWHGLLAPATEHHLRAIVRHEAQQDITRILLVARANRWLADLKEVSDDAE